MDVMWMSCGCHVDVMWMVEALWTWYVNLTIRGRMATDRRVGEGERENGGSQWTELTDGANGRRELL